MRINAERDGQAVADGGNDERVLGVLAYVLAREGAELSALEYQARQLSEADNLGELNAILQTLTSSAQAERYKRIVAAHLPAGYDSAALDTPTARWLYRSVRAAELSGLNPERVVREAIEGRTLTGARDVAAVLDKRIRQATEGAVPQPVNLDRARCGRRQLPRAVRLHRRVQGDRSRARPRRARQAGTVVRGRPGTRAGSPDGPQPGDRRQALPDGFILECGSRMGASRRQPGSGACPGEPGGRAAGRDPQRG